jgi:Protein of unknown function (DUF2800)
MQNAHAKYGPSGAKSRLICPGHQSMPGSSEASEQGDRLHMVCEYDGNEDAASEHYVQYKNKSWYTLEPEEREWVHMALDYVGSLPAAVQVHKEYKLDLTGLGFAGMDFGTADQIRVVSPEDYHLIDYKFGWGAIDDVEKNYQFIIYALGMFDNFPEAQTITVHMIQPKLNVVDCHTWTRDDVPRLHALIKASHDKVIQFEETKDVTLLNVDPINCERCRHQGNCPKWHELGIATVESMNDNNLTKDEEPKNQIVPSMIPDIINQTWDVASADPVRVAQFLACIPAFEAFLSKFKKFALEVNNLVGEIPGFSVVTTAGKSELISPNDVVALVSKQFDITPAEIIGTMKPSLTELKSLVSSKAPRGDKAKYAEAVVEALSDNGLILKQEGSSYLKRKTTKAK